MREEEKGKQRTEGDVEVAEGAINDGHVDSKLGVAESGEDDVRAGVEVVGATGGAEDSGTDHAADVSMNT